MVVHLTKRKTSIYVDEERWSSFKKHSSSRGKGMTDLLSELIEDEVLEVSLDGALAELASRESLELDFEPVKPKKGTVSELIRTERDNRR